MPDSRFECALFCIGNGANGKSIITEALANAIGHDVRSSLTFHQICANGPKHVHRLDKKLINVGTETENRMIKEDDIFKKIVSGERFEAERLYREGFPLQTNCKLCFLSNHVPQFEFGTEAENRRLRIIQFSKRFDEENRDLKLKEKLVEDYIGILAYLVRRLPRLYKMTEMSKGSYVSRKGLAMFRISNDIIGSFLAQCTQNCGQSFSVTRDVLYRTFREFCNRHDRDNIISERQFFRLLKRLRPDINTRFNVRTINQAATKACKGLQLSEYGMDIFQEAMNLLVTKSKLNLWRNK
jgi:putative DNA primase/helicase